MSGYKVSIQNFNELTDIGLRSLLQQEFNDLVFLNNTSKNSFESQSPDLIISGVLNDHILAGLLESPRPAVLLITPVERNDYHLNAALQRGVDGFLTPECGRDEIAQAVLAVRAKDQFYCQKVIKAVLNKQKEDDCDPVSLSPREIEVVKLIAKGLSTAQIADQLHLSVHTINSHRKRIMKKLELKSPVELVRFAFETGLVG